MAGGGGLGPPHECPQWVESGRSPTGGERTLRLTDQIRPTAQAALGNAPNDSILHQGGKRGPSAEDQEIRAMCCLLERSLPRPQKRRRRRHWMPDDPSRVRRSLPGGSPAMGSRSNVRLSGRVVEILAPVCWLLRHPSAKGKAPIQALLHPSGGCSSAEFTQATKVRNGSKADGGYQPRTRHLRPGRRADIPNVGYGWRADFVCRK